MKYVIAAAILSMPALALAQQASTKSMNIENSPTARTKSTTTITANVTNRSRKDATKGVIVFDNEFGSCTATFGLIHKQGGSASGSCVLDGYALTAKVAFDAADNTHWVGLAGDGNAFDTIDIGLNDTK